MTQTPNAAPPSGTPGTVTSAAAPASGTRTRRNALVWVFGLISGVGLVYGGYWWFQLRGSERTDNAYVHAPLVQVAAQQAGTVVAVLVEDTERVGEGKVLVRLDAAEARLARERAEAQLAQAVREARALVAQDTVLLAGIRTRESELERLRAEEARAADDLARRVPLLATGAVGQEEVAHARSTLAALQAARMAASSALESSREQRLAHRVQFEGLRIEQLPSVERAATALREALLAESRLEIPAPVAGQVARRTVQVGQRITAGQALMSVVPLDQVWVEANFKEVQLRDMRIGQPVHLRADLHGQAIDYRGHVAGLGAGTGAAFAVLPAQNATGNWVKVVQRVPVRIELEASQLQKHPLRVGLSMHATVDVTREEGERLSDFKSPQRAQETPVYDQALARADEQVRAIIARHAGRSAAPGR
ncbi:MAG: HlyD family efflux transporter periplasmic adaptor subunit [Burkholderiaceae bacterium]